MLKEQHVLDTQLSRQEIPAICCHSETLNTKTHVKLVEWRNQNSISFDVVYSYRCGRVIRVWECQWMGCQSTGKVRSMKGGDWTTNIWQENTILSQENLRIHCMCVILIVANDLWLLIHHDLAQPTFHLKLLHGINTLMFHVSFYFTRIICQ
jgi:hypothetical protein